jgi:hypothetical protein
MHARPEDAADGGIALEDRGRDARGDGVQNHIDAAGDQSRPRIKETHHLFGVRSNPIGRISSDHAAGLRVRRPGPVLIVRRISRGLISVAAFALQETEWGRAGKDLPADARWFVDKLAWRRAP